ncbi:MAG: hypothetical protein S4CHLAM2_07100 [Chlamydiales bacterium]|nr:hypothetical protein [Chlamydiales bacterium]
MYSTASLSPKPTGSWPPFHIQELKKSSLKELFQNLQPLPLGGAAGAANDIHATRYSTPTYSNHGLPADEKMRVQLNHAVREGEAQDELHIFNLSLNQPVDSLIDPTISQPNIGAASVQNRAHRPRMEDVCFAHTFDVELEDGSILAIRCAVVCDGHGDRSFAGLRAQARLPILMQEKLKSNDFTSIADTFTQVMLQLDQEIRVDLVSRDIGEGGTTFTGIFFIDDKIFVVNVGDGRAILCKKQAVYQLTEDADPTNKRFQSFTKVSEIFFHPINKRIYGNVRAEISEGKPVVRGEGGYNLSRDLGSKWLSPRPKITYLTRDNQPDDLVNMYLYGSQGSYIVIASDGLWGWVTNKDVYAAILKMEERAIPVEEMAARLVLGAVEAGSDDNITVVIVKL